MSSTLSLLLFTVLLHPTWTSSGPGETGIGTGAKDTTITSIVTDSNSNSNSKAELTRSLSAGIVVGVGSVSANSSGSSASGGDNSDHYFYANTSANGNSSLELELERRRRTDVYENWANSILTEGRGSSASSDSGNDGGGIKNYSRAERSSSKSRSGRSVCKISEFGCRGGKCITADRFCDGFDDCGDSSDEPRFCTPCNRTYYGEWGSTYSISLTSATIAAALGLSHEQQLLHGHQASQSQSLSQSKSRTEEGSSIPLTTKIKQIQSGIGPGKKAVALPQFVCQLSFAAAGDNFGDFVQVMFDSINIGNFASPTQDGCPDGYLQVAEINRPLTGGKWCGSGQGYSVYFSETSAIALTLAVGYSGNGVGSGGVSGSGRSRGGSPSGHVNSSVLSPLTPPAGKKTMYELTLTSAPNKPAGASADDFEFKIRYKFIPRTLASVRFGPHGTAMERGEVVPGSYCSRDFESCHRRRCKIQSPNYPGLYPRNVTCHFTIRHREKQPCKHVLIQVGQLKGHKVQLKTPPTGSSQSVSGSAPGPMSGSSHSQSLLIQEDSIVAWDDCSIGNRDSLTIYDGNSVDDPILLVVCGGSHIPPVTSSNSELLVVFRATPFGNPLDPKPSPPFPEPLRGFELDVDVITVDSESAEYTNFKKNCTFYFVSEPSDKCLMYKPQEHGGNWVTGRRGRVISPRYTISPNTTCRYEFKGTKHETVWIYFVSYSRAPSKDSRQYEGNCSTRLTIRDGIDARNEALLGNYCEPDLPKLCDHKALQNESRVVRSCTETESYISAGSRLIIEQGFLEGTALRPIHYQFYYEFVSRHSGTDGTCNRHFLLSKMKPKGIIRTTDNVFDFGRGGRSNLTCTYTFILGTYEALKLTVKNASFGDRPCRTVTDFETGRHICNYIAQPYQTNQQTPENSTDAKSTGSGSSSSPNEGQFLRGEFPPRSELNVLEYIWTNSNITSHKHCLCSNSSGSSGPSFTFLGRKVELVFKVDGMNARDSYENFFVHLEYEVLKGSGCRGDNHHMRTESGLISLDSTFTHGPKPPSCDHYPWLLEAKDNHSLYLRIPGFPMLEEKRSQTSQTKSFPSAPITNPSYTHNYGNETSDNLTSSNSIQIQPQSATDTANLQILPGLAKFQIDRICPTTKNRIFIYDGDNKLVQKICPASVSPLTKKSLSPIVEIYSDDFGKFHSPLFPPSRSRFVIEFVGKELGSYQIKWLELISAKMKTTLKAMDYDPGGSGPKGVGKSNNLSVFTDIEQDQLRRGGKLSWDETLTKLFEGQNGDDQTSVTDSLHTPSILGADATAFGSAICASYCPELRACISDKLWCDGEVHCPTSKQDEKQCDTFWATVNQLLSPAVYIPLIAAVLSAFCCCGLVILCVALKRMVINMRDKGQLGIGSASSSRTSTVDRRIPSRDYFYDPHQPVS